MVLKPKGGFMETFVYVGYLGIAIAVYMMPWLAAIGRKHTASSAIGFLNLTLGWTLLGWLIAMIWALTQNNTRR
jgi:hydrogenase-4 membrane subunit HyfE